MIKNKTELSLKKLSVLGLQHVLAMYAGAVIVPLLVGNALGLTLDQLSFLVSADLFTCGIATILQAKGIGNYAGVRLPVIMGCAFPAVAPMIVIGKNFGILAIYGAVIGAGIFVFLIAPVFKKFLKFFPPLVIGLIIILIGLTLMPAAISNILNQQNASNFGLLQNVCLALGVIIFIVLANKFLKGFLQTISILLSLILGTLVAFFLGMVDPSNIGHAEWFRVIKPFYFGLPSFTLTGTLCMLLVALIAMVESTGVFLTLGKICTQDVCHERVVKGLRAEGIAQILGGIFNAFPYTTFSQNIGLVVLTKVTDNKVGISAGIILILLGLIPKFGALATTIPSAVLGGAMIPMFGLVTAYGIKILQTVDLKNTNNLLIIAITLGVGLGITINQAQFEHAPEFIKTLFSNGIIVGGLIAIVLNAFFQRGNLSNLNLQYLEADNKVSEIL